LPKTALENIVHCDFKPMYTYIMYVTFGLSLFLICIIFITGERAAETIKNSLIKVIYFIVSSKVTRK